MSNQSTISLLRSQIKALKAAGEAELANQLSKRVSELSNEPPEVTMVFSDGRVYFRTPYPGRPRQYPFSLGLKEAGKDVDGSTTHKWDSKTKMWSFKATPEIVERVKQIIGDFFSESPLVDAEGERIGTLPASTYVPKS